VKVIQSELVRRIEHKRFDDGYFVRPSDVVEAFNLWKLNRRDSISDLSMNNVKFVGSEFFMHIHFLKHFNSQCWA
jgi:hypothetical protein